MSAGTRVSIVSTEVGFAGDRYGTVLAFMKPWPWHRRRYTPIVYVLLDRSRRRVWLPAARVLETV